MMNSRVLMRCEVCGYVLVTDHGDWVQFNFGSWYIYRDTGKVVAHCRRCQKHHVIDAGADTKAVSVMPPLISLVFLTTLDKGKEAVI